MERGNGSKPRGKDRLGVLEVEAFARAAVVGKKLLDGGGLMLVINRTGSASWRVRYWIDGAEKSYSIGTYPEVSLKEAREERDVVLRQVKLGHDPVKARLVAKAAAIEADKTTFQAVAEDWLKLRRHDWGDAHYVRSARALERDVYPILGGLPIDRITTPMVARCIQKIAQRGVRETALKILQNVHWIFRFACAQGLCTHNPAPGAEEMLPSKPKRSDRLPALLKFTELGDVLRRAELARVSPTIRMAHRLIAYTAVRIGNAVEAHWSEFHLDDERPVWVIPRAKMKAQDRHHDHQVFLGDTIADELRRWRAATGCKSWLFPSATGEGVITRDGIEKFYRVTLGLRGKHSPHGWRSALSTLAREEGGFERDVVELALDHIHDTEVVRAYDRGERLEQRIRMMAWWGEQLDRAQQGADVIPLRSRKAA